MSTQTASETYTAHDYLVRPDMLVYPDAKKAKVWRSLAEEYRKVGDFHDESRCFCLSKCTIVFDFGRLWKRKV